MRDYQQDAFNRLRGSLAVKRTRPMLQAATGAGKTLLSAHIIASALTKGRRVMFTVPAISLVDQSVRAFYEEGIHEIGVIQANHHMTDHSKPVQVVSVQTLGKREVPKPGLVLVDEAHVQHSIIKQLIEEWPEVPFIGLSATPWSKGLGRYYDSLIVVATTADLIRKGWLSPFRVFAPSMPDLTGVKVTMTAHGKDYAEGELSERMQKGTLTADITATWLERGKGKPTLGFFVDCAHAMAVTRAFEAVGVRAVYQDGSTPAHERELIRKGFHNGDVEIVCSVATLGVGIDWDCRCIIWGRPTQSPQFFVQGFGRGLRPVYPDGFDAHSATDDGRKAAIARGPKPWLTVLDHAGATLSLGFPTDIHFDRLDGGAPAKAAEAKPPAKPRECPQCTLVFPRFARECPNCGFTPALQPRSIETQAGELVELDERRKSKEPSPAEKRQFFAELRGYAADHGKSEGFCLASFRERYHHWPHGKDSILPAEPSPATLSWLHSRRIAWAKRKAKEQQGRAAG
jgi:superfamily II DNA or RNA helicase